MDYSTDSWASFLGKSVAIFVQTGSEAFRSFGFQGWNGLWSRNKSNQRISGICILRRGAGGGRKADIVVEFPRKRTENFDTGKGADFLEKRGGAKELAEFQQKAVAWQAMNPKPTVSDGVTKRLLAEDAVEQKNFGPALDYYRAGITIDPTWAFAISRARAG